MLRNILLITFSFLFFQTSISQDSLKVNALQHIRHIKQGIILVRIHSDDVTIATMKKYHQSNLLREKQREIAERNARIYQAFTTQFTFTDVYFFYGHSTDSMLNRNYNGIFLNDELVEDTNITIPLNKPIYIIEVGDIYFESFGGHFQGMMVMTDKLVPLQKPFPFYIRQRSGLAIIKRSYVDMVMVLQKKFETLFNTITEY